MKNLFILIVLSTGLSSAASADIWKWLDANGSTHFVDTNTPIYTWIDRTGRRTYSDTPKHKDAVSVRLVWHSSGSLDNIEQATVDMQAHYCARATEILQTYLSAPRLYRTSDLGEREFLSDDEAAATIAATRDKVESLCS